MPTQSRREITRLESACYLEVAGVYLHRAVEFVTMASTIDRVMDPEEQLEITSCRSPT